MISAISFMFGRWMHVEVKDTIDHQRLLDRVLPLNDRLDSGPHLPNVPLNVRLDKVPHLPKVALEGGGHVGGQQETEWKIVYSLR